MYKKISDYGIIGDLHTVALVGLDGSIDWLCMPYIDSPSIFAAILDDEKGGRFSVSPVGEGWQSTAMYEPGTNVLVTTFRTPSGLLKLTDFMPVHPGVERGAEKERHEIFRLAQCTEGEVRVRAYFDPQFDYARAEAYLRREGNGILASSEGGESLYLASSEEMTISGCVCEAEFSLSEGQGAWLNMTYGPSSGEGLDPARAEKALEETEDYWREWLRKSETGRPLDLGKYKDMVERSALVLKLLYYAPTGTIAAAPTTSLPEEIGGMRNWDYRFTWIRDASFTLRALFNLGHLSETEGYLRWITGVLREHGTGRLQIMYGLRGEEDLREEELPHLAGYRGSRPVRIGNAAARQRQLDIYGEIMDAALKLSDYVGKIDPGAWPYLRGICDHVVKHWGEKDSGIWEVRGGPWHFVYSKVMCWLALDRGTTIARRYGFPADLDRWERTMGEIRAEVLARGWSDEKKSFVQHYDTEALDASSLVFPMLGFVPFDDPRAKSTMEAVRKELGHGGFLYRYRSEDGLRGGEGVFLLCNFWLVDNLVEQGRLEEAEVLLAKMEAVANHLGLFSEQYDLETGELLGNFPQAFTHIGYVNSVVALVSARAEREEREHVHRKAPLVGKVVLNDGEPGKEVRPEEMARRLKGQMNILRGAFFDTRTGRVAYEKMRRSEAYREYLELSYALNRMDLGSLKSREERLAFWINLYNVLVIHGVIELGVRDSIKEVRGFLKRVQYGIGGMLFSPEDIEHGILRGNRRPPLSPLRRFGGGDPRLGHAVKPLEPRVHFALVCASVSCPPVGVYTPEELDRELDIAARTFINAGGVVLDREAKRVSLSRIFKWYAPDFGDSMAGRLSFLAGFFYDEGEREFLRKNADSLWVDYQDYDWRLNRG
jgi:GH15 family glucan-1,4-alpha-glucosidase